MNDPAWEALQAYAAARIRTALETQHRPHPQRPAEIAEAAADDILREARGYFFSRLRDMTANLPR